MKYILHCRIDSILQSLIFSLTLSTFRQLEYYNIAVHHRVYILYLYLKKNNVIQHIYLLKHIFSADNYNGIG